MQFQNLFLLLFEAFTYFFVMAALLHARERIGVGVFVAVLGVMHFMETYLAAVFYVELPFGVISPGSSVLFSGKLVMILLLYIKEDAATVRQPIYGLLAGNFLTVGLSLILKLHTTVPIALNRSADFGFMDEMGILMLWGTSLLYLDSLAIILIYENLGKWLGRHTVARIALCSALVLTFDQAGFYAALSYVNGAPIEVFWGGWFAKIGASVVFSGLCGIYLALSASGRPKASRTVGDIFNDLTFRERYEDLLARSAYDTLTGVHNRDRLEYEGPDLIRDALKKRRAISVLVVDADHFKLINDRFGHLEGDAVLQKLALRLKDNLSALDRIYRFGGEEFVIILDESDQRHAYEVAERMRLDVIANITAANDLPVSVSIGVATAPDDGESLLELISSADKYLYRAKKSGRNAVLGRAAYKDPEQKNAGELLTVSEQT